MPCLVDPSTRNPDFLVGIEAISVGNNKASRLCGNTIITDVLRISEVDFMIRYFSIDFLSTG